jgi:hypothetical protein
MHNGDDFRNWHVNCHSTGTIDGLFACSYGLRFITAIVCQQAVWS